MRALLTLAALAAASALAGCAGNGGEENAPPAGEESPPTTATSVQGTTEMQRATTARKRAKPLRLRLERVVSGLASPVHVAAAPGEPARLYVVEQAGRIRLIENGRVRAQPFLDIRDEVTSGGEQGLLSVAFHPDYEENRRLYVAYTARDGDNTVVAYRANREGTQVDEATRRVLLALADPYSNHNGGQLAFGPDGLLYTGTGDGGGGGDPENRAQDLSQLLGKLLRLNVDEAGAEWEIAAYGVRNPWRFSFDRENGDLYLGDVGQNAWEEVDSLPWPPTALVNFGWDVFEGRARYEEKEPNPAGRLVPPVVVYPLEGHCSVVGGFVYRGQAMPALRGRYLYGDFCSGHVWSFRIAAGKARGHRRERFTVEGLSSFGEDGNGELYLVSLSGTIYRLTSS